MEEILKNIAENFKQLSDKLPKQLEQAGKNMTKEDAEKIKKAMKDSGYEKAMKDLEKVKINFNKYR
jgi:hypothetical protein